MAAEFHGRKRRRRYDPEARSAYVQRYYQENSERIKERARRWQRENKDRMNARTRAWRAANPHKSREKTWRERGIKNATYRTYLWVLEAQNHACAVCARDLKPNEKQTHLDHDPRTGCWRGVLCSPCNVAIGMFQESTGVMERATQYLAEV